MKLSELASRLGADLSGGGDIEITGVAGLAEARPGEVTFLADKGRAGELQATRASAVIAPPGVPRDFVPLLVVKNPKLAFARALRLFHERPYAAGGVSERAVIGKDAVIGAEPTIHPYAVVSDGARIGDRVTLYPGVFVGPGAAIGDDSVVYPNVSILEGVSIGKRVIVHAGTVIGSDGFGFVFDSGSHHKIPQVGGVIIEDDVEIGANTTIDRATLGNTVVRRGTKLDNLVQIAHNVSVGEHCVLAAQAGIAGSTKLGSYVVFGGQAAISDHLTVGDRAMVGGAAGVTKSLDAGAVVAGHPAVPVREWLRSQAVVQKLPELKKLVAQLQKRIEELEKRS